MRYLRAPRFLIRRSNAKASADALTGSHRQRYTRRVSPNETTCLSRRARPWLWLFVALVALYSTACSTSHSRANQRAATEERAQQRTEENLIRIPLDPVHLRADYGHPEYTIRQAFLWGPFATEWRWSVVDTAAEYGGFHVKYPFPLPSRIDGMVLYFELWPPRAAPHLALGLIDQRGRAVTETPVVPIAPYRIHTRFPTRNARYAIPLRVFESHANRRIQWNQITGLHAVRLEPRDAGPRHIVFHHIQFAPNLWIQEMQKGMAR